MVSRMRFGLDAQDFCVRQRLVGRRVYIFFDLSRHGRAIRDYSLFESPQLRAIGKSERWKTHQRLAFVPTLDQDAPLPISPGRNSLYAALSHKILSFFGFP